MVMEANGIVQFTVILRRQERLSTAVCWPCFAAAKFVVAALQGTHNLFIIQGFPVFLARLAASSIRGVLAGAAAISSRPLHTGI